MSNDDEKWFNSLTGKSDEDADGRLLREALQRRESAAPSESVSSQEVDQLLFRLKKEGLLNKPKRATFNHWLMGIAASLFVVFLSLNLIFDRSAITDDDMAVLLHPDIQVMRSLPSDNDQQQQFIFNDPHLLATTLSKVFTHYGINGDVTPTVEGYRFSASLPEDAPIALTELLIDMQIDIPDNRNLIIVYRK